MVVITNGSLLIQPHGSLQLLPNNEAAVTHFARTPQRIFASSYRLPCFKIARQISSQIGQISFFSLSMDHIVLSPGRGRDLDERPINITATYVF
jgi:hypothetical protein